MAVPLVNPNEVSPRERSFERSARRSVRRSHQRIRRSRSTSAVIQRNEVLTFIYLNNMLQKLKNVLGESSKVGYSTSRDRNILK